MSSVIADDQSKDALESPADGQSAEQRGQEPVLEEELLVEEVSIDGMCGVY